MIKKVLALAVAFALTFAFALPASALQATTSQLAGIAVSSRAVASDAVVYVYSNGAAYTQGKGVTWIYDLGGLLDNEGEQDWRLDVSASGAGSVDIKARAAADRFSITAKTPGRVTVTCTETWTEYEDVLDYDELDEWGDPIESEVPVERTAAHSFTVKVLGLSNATGTLTRYVSQETTSATFAFKVRGLPAGATVSVASDSNKRGSAYVRSVSAGKVVLSIYGLGVHVVKLKAFGRIIPCKAVLRSVGLKKTADVADTGSLVAYPGMKSTLAAELTGAKSPKVSWRTTNPKVAKVSSGGVVTAVGKGRCYAKAKVGDVSMKVLVEVTSEKAYRAVRNGFADMRTKLTYSQPMRMSANCRDCSSFVSRCYWDVSKGRRLALIGGSAAASWAYNAAAQAQWLNANGRRVSWDACSADKLRPGDTIYFETDYAGKDASQWRYIDHAALYVGNGLYLNTGGWGGAGTVGLARYGSGNVKFIGRPCP